MKKFVFTFFLALCFNLSYSQVTGTAALIVIEDIDASIKRQLQTIDNLATNAIGNTGNMIFSVSARLKKDINETIGNTDNMLRENQLLLYNQLLNLSADFNKLVEGNIKEVDVITTKVIETIDNFIVQKKEPRIFRYETQSFIKGYSKDYTFKIRGKNFDKSDEIIIQINEKDYKPIQSTYDELIFRIDTSDVVLFSEGAYYADLKIRFNWKKGLFNKKMTTVVPFIIPVTPLEIGQVTVFFEQSLPEKKYSDMISYSCNCNTDRSGTFGNVRRNAIPFNIIPTNGRLFDLSSVNIINWHQRYGGNYSFDHQTEQQIRGIITCNSESQPRGGGGFSTLTFEYREYEIIYRIHKKQTSTIRLTSVNPIIFDLPEPVDNKKPNINFAIVKTYDNKEFILTPNNPNKYFDLRMNAATLDVTVSWKN